MSNENKKGNTGCFIIVFLLIASGIPLALTQTKEDSIGAIVVVIGGIVVAWYLAKTLSDS